MAVEKQLTIRPAIASDNSRIRDIVQTSLGDFGIVVEFDGLDAAIGNAGFPESKNTIELVAVYAGEICGCVAVQEIDQHQGKLFGFHVDHQLRGKGIGRALLTHALGKARQLGYTGLHLDTWDNMHSAIRLYESLGWIAAPDPAPESGANRAYFLDIS